MGRTLIAVKSCWRDLDAACHEAIRMTWAKDAWHTPFDLCFFVGQPDREKVQGDEFVLDCPDGYDELPYKTQSIIHYSLSGAYDHVFFCDTDTFIIPRLLAKCGYENYDYAGRFGAMPELGSTFNYRDARGTYPNCHPWGSGGIGYFLSKRAMIAVFESGEPTVWAEDMWIGQALGPLIQSGEIKGLNIPNFECQIAWHFPRREYDNKCYNTDFGWMQKMYDIYGEGR